MSSSFVRPVKEKAKPQSIFTNQRPAMSIVQFVGSSYETIGSIWLDHVDKGNLTLKLDLTKITADEVESIVAIGFPKDWFRKQILERTLSRRQSNSSELSLYNCFHDASSSESIGCLVHNSSTGDYQLKLTLTSFESAFDSTKELSLVPTLEHSVHIGSDRLAS